jgi:hypothetical protein
MLFRRASIQVFMMVTRGLLICRIGVLQYTLRGVPGYSLLLVSGQWLMLGDIVSVPSRVSA